jgi:phosphoribosylanthranilate isomerase
MTRIKICGITTLDDALMCADAGADMLGLNFYPASPRYVKPETAQTITRALRQTLGAACPRLIGVFVNLGADEIAPIMQIAGLDAAQLSGDEPESVLAGLNGRGFKAIRPRSRSEALQNAVVYRQSAPDDESLPSLLVDAYHPALYGGTGEQASFVVAMTVRESVPRMMLAGGLTPENVAGRAQVVRPWGVDVASGVESQPGIKDPARVRDFIAAAREVK